MNILQRLVGTDPKRSSSNEKADFSTGSPEQIQKDLSSARSQKVDGSVKKKNMQDSIQKDENILIDVEFDQSVLTREQSQSLIENSSTRVFKSYTVTIQKGNHGLGLDLAKAEDGRAYVLKLKEFVDHINPASVCSKPLKSGDVIVAVNGKSTNNFMEVVSLIRSSSSSVTLTFIRLE